LSEDVDAKNIGNGRFQPDELFFIFIVCADLFDWTDHII